MRQALLRRGGWSGANWLPSRMCLRRRSDFVDAASLLVSELVTNAIVHARTDVELRLMADDRMLRAEVSDGNPTFPSPRRPMGLAGTGRGLLLMDDLASRWGVSPTGAGKTVWFELTFASFTCAS